MRRAFEDGRESLRESIIGLGDRSGSKSYYPLLRARLADLERFRALLDESSDAIMLIELPGGVVSDVNAMACQMLGFSRAELIGRSIGEICPDMAAHVGELDGGSKRLRIETTLRARDGGPVAVETTLAVAQSGTARYAVASSRDISRRQAVERALRASERRARAVFEGAGIGLMVLDVSGRIRETNAVYQTLVGYGAEESRGEHFTRFVPDTEADWLCRSFDRLVSGRDDRQAFETRWLRRVGEPFDARITASLLSPEQDSPALVVASVEDISARKRIEEERLRLNAELEATNRMKDEFLTRISHELRTPLTCILAWAPLLQAGRVQGEVLSRGVAALERNARELAKMIDDLLDVSCLMAGTLKIQRVPVRLATIVEEAVARFRPAIEARRLALALSVDRAADGLSGDPARLNQVVGNLLDNAIKFTPEGGHLEVRLRRDEGWAEIVVADDGQGIEPDLLPHVFECFRAPGSRLMSTSSRTKLGLGLAIVHGVVTLHGGLVHAESRGRGTGSRFTVRLPLPDGGAGASP